MSPNDDALLKDYFTDFDGKFKARLSHLRAKRIREGSRESHGVHAKHTGIIKVEYHKDLMGLIEEGILVAVRNYRAFHQRQPRFTLLEVAAIWPSHFGLRGLGEQAYYPLQFEIIEQSVVDWESADTSTMMIRLSTIPINYDLILHPDKDPEFIRGFSYPIPAEEAFIVNRELINLMYNKSIIQNLKKVPAKTSSKARQDPRLGVLKMFEAAKEDIPLYVDFERLVRYHFGVFAFTGGGKSNLLSNLIRRLLYHTDDTKLVIFDVASEYPFLLMDVFNDSKIPAYIILENKVLNANQLATSIVRPRDYEANPEVTEALTGLFNRGIVGYLAREPRSTTYTYGTIFQELNDLSEQSAGRPTYQNAIALIEQQVSQYITENKHKEEEPVNSTFVAFLDRAAQNAVQEFRVSDRSQLHAWATTRSKAIKIEDLSETTREPESQDENAFTIDQLKNFIEGDNRLLCLSIADPNTIRQIVVTLTHQVLSGRKKRFQVKPYVLFVFDEAQEFIPQIGGTGVSQSERESSYSVEQLLRQGRKYGLGACIATQRIAHLNTSALQQLHTFFVGTLPRPYDRTVVSSTFLVDQDILEKTLEFGPGEWLLSSYIATGMTNVPIFLRADNAENEIDDFLSKSFSKSH